MTDAAVERGYPVADVLDQSEVDKLLAGAMTGPEPVSNAQPTVFSRHRRDVAQVEVRPYDFRRPERVSKDQMRALQTLHETFARNFGASLSGFLRTIVEVRVATCEQMTYAEFTSSLPNPTSFNLIAADGLDGQMCLEVSPLIVYRIIDRLLGGSSQEIFIPQRPMTQIESRLIGNVTTRGLAALAEAWEAVKKLSFRITASESNPQLVQIVPPNEVVVVVGCEVKMGNRAGTLNLCIPYNVIEPVMERLSSQSWFSASKNARSDATQKQIVERLSSAGLELTGLLARTTITVEDLANLAPGDLIVTDRRAAEPVICCVAGEPKLLAQLGRHRNLRALKVVRPLNDEDRLTLG
ncbi:MAG: flagellar motor switch protein FliM [Phycisphaerales bacterium]|nr:flagellar motor switch protein FliM [Phycisphaerales bacterium]